MQQTLEKATCTVAHNRQLDMLSSLHVLKARVPAHVPLNKRSACVCTSSTGEVLVYVPVVHVTALSDGAGMQQEEATSDGRGFKRSGFRV